MIQEAAEYKIQLNAFAQGRFNGARYFASKESLGNGLLVLDDHGFTTISRRAAAGADFKAIYQVVERFRQ